MASLAPGFRFHPTDEELISYYLKRKVCKKPFRFDAISEIDIYKFEPWDLPGLSLLRSRDLEWYFFSALDRKYGNGSRTNRATELGYWKTTGKDRSIRSVRRGDSIVGMKKTLVYHMGRAPRGQRTNWVMHEYRLVDEALEHAGIAQDGLVLCRVFQKSGSGPKNGEQYGAPFIEEEWDDDDTLVPKAEVEENPYHEVNVPEHSEQQNDDNLESNHGLAIAPVNGHSVGSDGGDDHNLFQESRVFLKEDQKLFIGKGKTEAFTYEQNLIVSPDDFQMEQLPVEEEYFEIDELLNPVESSHNADDLVDGEPVHVDSPSDAPIVKEYLEINDLIHTREDPSRIKILDEQPVEADAPHFEMLDEYLKYFDATDNYLTCIDFDSLEALEVKDLVSNESNLSKEVDVGDGKACLAFPEFSKTCASEGASSSKQKPEVAKVEPGVPYNDEDDTLAKTVSRMLGSFPAPHAYAAEFPMEKSTLGQSSTTHSSSSIHVTAGMIRISGITTSASRKHWPIGKTGDVDLLHYGMSRTNIMPIESMNSNAIQPMANMLSGGTGLVMMRSGFFLVCLWVLILSVSYKIGSYIYTR